MPLPENSGNSCQRDRSFNIVRGRGFPNGRGYCTLFPGGRGQSFGRCGHGHAGSFRPLCQICNKLGHYATTYYQRFDQTSQHEAQSPLQAFYSSPSLPTDDSRYPDSGATHHLTLSSDAYTGSDRIRVGNGRCLSIHNIGSTILSSPHRSFFLKQLLHVPSICKNLLSVHHFAHDNEVYFEFHYSFLSSKTVKPGQSFTGVHLRMVFISCCLLPLPFHLHTLLLVKGLPLINGTNAWVIQLCVLLNT